MTEADVAEDVEASTAVEDVAVEHQEVVEAIEVAVVVVDAVEQLEVLKSSLSLGDVTRESSLHGMYSGLIGVFFDQRILTIATEERKTCL